MLKPADMPQLLEEFLRRRNPHTEKLVVSSYEPISGGYSRLMARFTASMDGQERILVARSDPPPGQAVTETDRAQEWALLEALTKSGDVRMPDALYVDPDGSELGSKTIVLEHIRGATLLSRALSVDEAKQRDFADQLSGLAAHIHSIDTRILPPDLEVPKSWDSYIDGCIAQWRQAEARHIEPDPFYRYVATWLEENRPAPTPLSLVHGDFQTGNILVDETTDALVAVDWELAHIGDPREDLGWCRWVGALQPPDLVGDGERFAQTYCRHSKLGPDIVNPESIAYFSILAAVKVFEGVVGGIRAFAEDLNSSLTTAYLVGALTTGHEQWLRAATGFDAPSHSREGAR